MIRDRYQFTQAQAQHLTPAEFSHYASHGLVEGVHEYVGELCAGRHYHPIRQYRLPL